MAAYWVPDLHDIKDFSDHFKHSILFIANGASSAWSSKHLNTLGWVHGLCLMSSKLRTTKILKAGQRDWKRVGCHGMKIDKAVGVLHLELLACQVSMVSAANWCNIWLSVWHHDSCHLHILVNFQTSISLEPVQIFVNSKRHRKSFVQFYAINLKNQGVKIWS